MKRRNGFLLLLALWAAVPGCAGTARRDDGTSIFGPRAWSEPPAPPQRPVVLTANRPDGPTDPAPRQGLSKYFPGLLRNQTAEAPSVATAPPVPKYRPTWFGLRPPKPAGTQTYMTDNREMLNRSVATPTSLPVALQVPSDRPSGDRMVTPTNVEGSAGPSPSASANIPDFGGKPSKPGEDEVIPLPPANEPSTSVVVTGRMPQVPPVDPLESPSTPADRPAPKVVVYDDAAPDMDAVKTSTPPSEPPADGPSMPAQPTKQLAETSRMAPPSPQVYASPQSTPPPPPKPHVHTTTKVKPTPQAGETAKTWQRPCLRRLVRKVCKLGEYADPPTAKPH